MQEDRYDDIDHEIEDLKQELENFQKEKDRVRAIVGKIGGMPKFRTKLVNIIFIIFIVVSVTMTFFLKGEKWRLIMIELATVALSLKIIYLIDSQMKINHFKFWILSSLEWRLNEIMKMLKKMNKKND